MNGLDPELKRLMQWASRAPETRPADAPFGFAARVINQQGQRPGLYEIWQRAVSVSAWASVALIFCGLVFFRSEILPLKKPYDFTAPYQLLVKSITP